MLTNILKESKWKLIIKKPFMDTRKFYFKVIREFVSSKLIKTVKFVKYYGKGNLIAFDKIILEK